MPIAHFHLVDGAYADEQVDHLLTRACSVYAAVLDSPIERVRAFAVRYPAADVAVGGVLVASGAQPAPYFTAIVLAGRPEQQRHELLARFTALVVEELGCAAEVVRGRIEQVDPADWAIAGRPASLVRVSEVAERALAPGRVILPDVRRA